MSHLQIIGRSPLNWEGRDGTLYRVRHPHAIIGRDDIDDVLSHFPLAVFQPPGRNPSETPLIIGLQGMGAPMHWNAFAVPTLLDMGIACAFFDTPFAGERSLIRDDDAPFIRQLVPFAKMGVTVRLPNLVAMFEAVASDVRATLDFLRGEHGLTSPRVAVFGVSLGCLLGSLAFAKYGVGSRMLGVIGHPDLANFARTYTPQAAPLLTSIPGRMVAHLLSLRDPYPKTVVRFLMLLKSLAAGRTPEIDPLKFRDRVTADRRLRLLVGELDPVVSTEDAEKAASQFPDGEAYVVPGMCHGEVASGPTFVEHVRTYIGTQLGDWRG